jgi:hypothetical protein
MILGAPAWWFTIDSSLPILAGGAVFLLRDHLRGWRSLVVVTLVPGIYAGLNTAAGWPVFSVLNSKPGTAVVWAGGAASMALAILFGWMVLTALVPASSKVAVVQRQPVAV